MSRMGESFVRFMVLLLAVLGASLGPTLAAGKAPQRPGGLPAAPAKASTLSDRQACAIIKNTMTAAAMNSRNQLQGMHFVKEGILLDLARSKPLTATYADMVKADLDQKEYAFLRLLLGGKNKATITFSFPSTMEDRSQRLTALQTAMNTMMEHAHQGKSPLCSDDPADYAAELASFQRDTAAWRALSAKPPVTDEVYKNRLLAEDALKNKDLNAAAKFYEAGIAVSPTWDQGWYNAALVYAEMSNYLDAAVCMKHYVILVPDAPDVRAAKDNIILWEAKAASKQ